jgi:hypothetical protein
MHWKVGRLVALEDAIDVAGRAPELVDKIGGIGDQAAAKAVPGRYESAGFPKGYG